MKTAMIVVLICISLSACTMKAEVSEQDKNKIVTCTDTRDGESFSFHTNTVRDTWVGLNDTCYTATDFQGRNRKLCGSMIDFMKCISRTAR